MGGRGEHEKGPGRTSYLQLEGPNFSCANLSWHKPLERTVVALYTPNAPPTAESREKIVGRSPARRIHMHAPLV